MDLSLNVKQNIKRIKVNDAGEYISLNFDDQTLIPRLYGLIDYFGTVAQEHQREADALANMPEENQGERNEKIAAFAALQLESCEKLKAKVDEAFRDNVCQKVFGDIVPSVAAFADFFLQLGALVSGFEKDIVEQRFEAIRTSEKVQKYTGKYSGKRG